MNTDLLDYEVKDQNGNRIATYKIFKEDENKILEIINNFCCYGKGLIPHPWFGNINNPEILILGLNPSFTDDDKKDYEFKEEYNENEFTEFLINNLNFETREDNINWLLKSQSNLAKWWKNFFGINIKNGEELDDDRFKQIENISYKICILNYFGYNMTILNNKITLDSHIRLIENKEEKFKNVRVIILLWKGTYEKIWKPEFINIIPSNCTILYANGKNNRYSCIDTCRNIYDDKDYDFDEIIKIIQNK